MRNFDDVDVFANEHADRKKSGADKHKNKKKHKDGERRAKSVEGKQRWHFDRNHDYEED